MKVLEKMLPPPVGRGVAKLALVGAGVGGSSSTQAGEDVTVCNVIDTCERLWRISFSIRSVTSSVLEE